MRADFYYRLNVLSVNLPPLRDRGQDVLLLADVFLQNHARKIGRNYSVETQVEEAFSRYTWPGNVRELRNVIEYAVNMTEDSLITESHLPRWFEAAPAAPSAGSLAKIVQAVEQRVINNMLSHHGNSVDAKRRIARELGISMATLYNKIKESGTSS
jgi:sigma-54 dependent transcriptional regulator, acetoin dehydrogenase operon transcriptional activator AcoR